MEAWVAALLNAVISGIIIGLFKIAIDRGQDKREDHEIERANKFSEKVMEKFELISKEISHINIAIAVISSENKNIISRMDEHENRFSNLNN